MNHRGTENTGTNETTETQRHRDTEDGRGLSRIPSWEKHPDSDIHPVGPTVAMEVCAVSKPSIRTAGHRAAVVAGLLAIGLSGHGLGQAASHDERVPYPTGYREWVHVKSALVSARHADFEQAGGFRHIYANPQALTGYRTGTFPNGSVIVVDWIEGTDTNGAFTEGARRRVDVMVKDPSRFAATSGWGFERFKSDTEERMVTAVEKQCAACHAGPDARDMVFSTFRR